MYDLHTDCYSGKKIGKLHYFVERQEVHLSCLWGTDVCGTDVVPNLQSIF